MINGRKRSKLRCMLIPLLVLLAYPCIFAVLLLRHPESADSTSEKGDREPVLAAVALASESRAPAAIGQKERLQEVAVVSVQTNKAGELRDRQETNGQLPVGRSPPPPASLEPSAGTNTSASMECDRINGRCGPGWFIIGVMKGGTSSLFEYMPQYHPYIVPAATKEPNFFCDTYQYLGRARNFSTGLEWYMSLFADHERPFISGEASINYMAYANRVAPKIKAKLPNAKIIVLLRDPVDRFESQFYYHDYDLKMPPEKFTSMYIEAYECGVYHPHENIVRRNCTVERKAELHRQASKLTDILFVSFYAEHLKIWIDGFGRERILIIQSEQFFSRPAQVLLEVYDFLGLPRDKIRYPIDPEPINVGERKQRLPDAVRDQLSQFYRPLNEQLFRLIGQRYDWN